MHRSPIAFFLYLSIIYLLSFVKLETYYKFIDIRISLLKNRNGIIDTINIFDEFFEMLYGEKI